MANGSFPTSTWAGTLAAPLVMDNQDRSRPPLLSLFFAFQILGGHIGFPILLAVIFALRNPSSRHPLFINFCVIWIISSIVFCILLYAGYDTGPDPPFMICTVQASLVYAMPIMAAVSLWALVFHLWLSLREALTKAQIIRSRKRLWVLVALPYLVAIPYIVFPAIVAHMVPYRVARRQSGFGFHCTIDFQPLRMTVAISVAIPLVLLLVWVFLVARICYKNWRSVRTTRVYGWRSANLFARIAIFTLYIVIGIVACVIAIASPSNRFRILFQASLPTAAFLLFGTRPNLWRRRSEAQTVTSRRVRSGSSSPGSSNSGAASSNSSTGARGPAPSSRQEFTFFTTQDSARTASRPRTRSRTRSADGDEVRQAERASRASAIRSKSLQSVASEMEGNFGDKGHPVSRDVSLMGTTRGSEPKPKGTTWIAPRRGAVTWGDMQRPDEVEKGVQEEADDYVVDIKPIEKYRPGGYDVEKGLPRLPEAGLVRG